MKNLGQLLSEIDKTFRESKEYLERYFYVPEVNRFVENRQKDMDDFKKLVASRRVGEPLYIVRQFLKTRTSSKIYGGICRDEGAEYFAITQKVRRAIQIYEQELKKRRLDPDYVIYDELQPEEWESLE